jgi:hypothetical protein
VAESEALGALEEGGAALEGANGGFAAKEIGRGTFHKFESLTIGVIE